VELAAGSPSPPKRDMASLVAVGDGHLLLFGGRSEHQRALNDCWRFDTASQTWAQLQPDGPAPPPRKMAALSVLPGAAGAGHQTSAVLFGGERDSGLLDDCWVLQLPGGAAEAAADGGGSSGQQQVKVKWIQLRMKGGPSPRFGHAVHAVVAVAPATIEPAAAEEAIVNSSEPDQPPAAAAAAAAAPAAAAAAAAAVLSGLVYVFGGCVDQSSFPYLARSYQQTAELWGADMATET